MNETESNNQKITRIQARLDEMITRLESKFLVARPHIIEELKEIQNLLEDMRE